MVTRASILMALLVLQPACGDRTSIASAKDAAAKDGVADAVAFSDALLPSPDGLVAGSDVLVRSDVAPTGDTRTDSLTLPDLATEGDSAQDAPPDSSVPPDAVGRSDGALIDVRGDVPADLARDGGADIPPFAVDGALASFCFGDAPRLVVNGTASLPKVTGKIIPYDCCDGAEFDVTSPSFSLPIVFSWRRMVSAAFGYPASVDLAALPTTWSVQLYAGCNPIMSSCSSPGDWYASGMEGTLTVALAGSQLDMSLCLHVQESASTPHTILHSLDLYAPHVRTSY